MAGLTTGLKVSLKSMPGRWVKTTKDPVSLVPVQTAVGPELVAEDPLACHDIGALWSEDQVPCTVGLQRGELLLHGGPPVGVGKCGTIRARHRREGSHTEIEAVDGLTKTGLAAGHHRVLVDDG